MAADWAATVRRGGDEIREHFSNPAFFDFVGEVRGKTILDAGCGEGYNTRLLARAGAKVIGVDISEQQIELAEQSESGEPLGIRYQVASMCALTDTPDRSVDAVVSYMALMDSPNLDGALAELHRILVDRGDLYISILHPCFTNGGYAWLRTSKSARLRLVVSGYFDQRPWMNVWRLSHGPDDPAVPYEFPRFPRTLANYVNAIVIVRAGLTVVSMSEPRPTERTCRRLPELRRWRTCRLVLAHSREEGRLNGKADEGDC